MCIIKIAFSAEYKQNMYELEVHECSRPNCGPENIS